MKKVKNNLDERQEQALLKIERNGCWLAFWGLLAVLIVEQIRYGFEGFEYKAGEWAVFMTLALYIAIRCSINGIWDRHLKPNIKTNLLASLLAGVLLAIVNFFAIWGKYPDKPIGAAAGAIMSGMFTFILCFAGISTAASFTKRKQNALEKEPEDEE